MEYKAPMGASRSPQRRKKKRVNRTEVEAAPREAVRTAIFRRSGSVHVCNNLVIYVTPALFGMLFRHVCLWVHRAGCSPHTRSPMVLEFRYPNCGFIPARVVDFIRNNFCEGLEAEMFAELLQTKAVSRNLPTGLPAKLTSWRGLLLTSLGVQGTDATFRESLRLPMEFPRYSPSGASGVTLHSQDVIPSGVLPEG